MNFWTTVLLAWVGVNVLLVALMWRYQWLKQRNLALRSRLADALPEITPANTHSSQSHIAPPPVSPAASRWPSRSPEPRHQVQRRVVSLVAGDLAAAAGLDATEVSAEAQRRCLSEAASRCQLLDLHEEIRNLKLTVAELSLDKAMLSAAATRRKAAP